MIELTIPGFPVSKKNSRQNFKSGRSIPSERHRMWEQMAVAECQALYKGPMVKQCEVESYMVLPDRRRRDYDNMHTSILDMLVAAGILEDDSNQHVLKNTNSGEIDTEQDHGSTKIVLSNCRY